MSEWPQTHSWDVTPKEAIQIQKKLRHQVKIVDNYLPPDSVAGVDVGFIDNGKKTRAAVAVLSFPALELLEYETVVTETIFPYVPGLLSFREVPAILAALSRLQVLPDMILCDGQGYAHPRRLGIACHLGIITDIPTIGVAKTRLIGSHDVVPEEKGRWVELIDKDEIIGAVLRTREKVKPLYISPGHRVSLETAIHYVMACVTKYKLPETTRWAHRLASDIK
ncbi:MAG: deoxyribonuclease V [Gammaproteobacteria bacterium]|nr:deoxyribonuclease V [Gammaproteobacteria bacterium]